MYGRRDFAVLIIALVLLVLSGTRGQPTSDAPVSPEKTTSDQTAVDINSVNPTATTFFKSDNGLTESMKKAMWKRCVSKNYVTCAKLALVHLVDRLERANDSYSLVSGVTVSREKYHADVNDIGGGDVAAKTITDRDSSEAFNRLLVDKLGRYFSTLTLNVKLLDDATVQSVRKLGEAAADASIQSGRGKKQKYAQSILLAGWVTGAMLLALGMKAIAVLAGKALMTALMSLLLSGLASFRGGHSEPKSTTYEIVTKPVYSHSHSTADDTHAAGSQNNPAYRRSIGGSGGVASSGSSGGVVGLQHVPAPSSAEDADHVVYRIHTSDKTPIYIPIIDRRRRRRR